VRNDKKNRFGGKSKEERTNTPLNSDCAKFFWGGGGWGEGSEKGKQKKWSDGRKTPSSPQSQGIGKVEQKEGRIPKRSSKAREGKGGPGEKLHIE